MKLSFSQILMLFFTGRIEITCLDGNPRFIYKSINDVFPLEIKEAKNKVKIDGNILKEISGKIDTEHESKIKELLFRIDNVNSDMALQMRHIYLIYDKEPCTKGDYFDKESHLLLQDFRKFRECALSIQYLIELAKTKQTPEFLKLYSELIQKISYSSISNQSQTAIDKNRESEKQWEAL